jgi:prepilin-type N-terminal cleavage/methylation domain-containing protein
MNYFKRNGFTLLEMLLVTAIMGVILVMVIGYVTRKGEEFRRDKAVTQIQQTLNAGLSFYTDNGRWPYCGVAGCKLQSEKNEGPGKKPYIYELAENGYLPDMHILNPWGGEINYSPTAADSSSPDFYKNFAVCITIPASDSAMITANSIAGRLPMAYTTADVGECRVDKLLPTNPCVAGALLTSQASIVMEVAYRFLSVQET